MVVHEVGQAYGDSDGSEEAGDGRYDDPAPTPPPRPLFSTPVTVFPPRQVVQLEERSTIPPAKESPEATYGLVEVQGLRIRYLQNGREPNAKGPTDGTKLAMDALVFDPAAHGMDPVKCLRRLLEVLYQWQQVVVGENYGLALSRSLLVCNLRGDARDQVQDAFTVQLMLQRLLTVYATPAAVVELRCRVLGDRMRAGQTGAAYFKAIVLAHSPFGGDAPQYLEQCGRPKPDTAVPPLPPAWRKPSTGAGASSGL